MLTISRTIIEHRELIWALAWKNIIVRYKQAYLGLGWAVLRPLMLVLVFTLIKTFVGIDSGGIPYPVLTFAALMPWVLFQDATSEGVSSIVANANLIRKIYLPHEIFPLTAVFTRLIEFGITLVIFSAMMLYYTVTPTLHMLWAPFIILYVLAASLAVCFAGSAINVYFRDVSALLPMALSLLMYISPVIYPLSLVKQKLLEEHIMGEWSSILYTIYITNPLAGIIDSFQRVMLLGVPPDLSTLLPGVMLTTIALPLSYMLFRSAQAYFADVV